MKKKFKWVSLLLTLNFFIFNSCKKGELIAAGKLPIDTTNNPAVNALLRINAPDMFNYLTTNEVAVDITILAPDNTAIPYLPITILSKAEELGGIVLFKSLTDNNGRIITTIKLPSLLDQVVIDPKYPGILRNAAVKIVNGSIACTLGGTNGYLGNIVLNSPLNGRVESINGITFKPFSIAYSYMGSYDSQGKPDYLEAINRVINNSILANTNTSLPDGKNVGILHPEYLSGKMQTNLDVIISSDIYFTFFSQGASYKSAIAYFTYPTANPPQNSSQIDSLHIILPNASFIGSGGSLKPGNTIKLGWVSAGTSIGFALLTNAWNGTSDNYGYLINYTVDQLNSASDLNLKRQSVLLYDNIQQLFLIGFEDTRRDNPRCDNDFNDCLFLVQSTVPNAISLQNVNKIDNRGDKDGDGVADVDDAFPTDPTRAYINYYPSQNKVGTIVFEDSWPFIGDYDFNDLVVGYKYEMITNAQNKMIEMKADYVLKASGASFQNGFGVQFPFASSLVISATGSLVNSNSKVTTLGANGCETGQTKAVIIPFDNAYTAMNTTGGFNTYTGSPYLTRDTIKIDFNFVRPLDPSEFLTSEFNPFIIIDQTRGREAHLAGMKPTDKADPSYFKTGADNTSLAEGKYYKTTTNLPWALDFTTDFNYPEEVKAVNSAFTKFIPWAQSGGISFSNWYIDSSNIVSNLIYH